MPKKYKRVFFDSITYEKMYKAYLNARKSKRYRRDVILFNLRYEEKISLICKKIKNGKYNFGDFKEFYVYDPKKRRILAAPFEDKIVHTWYVKEFIEKIFVPTFASSSYACIKGKGMHKCALDVKKAMYNVSKKNKKSYTIPNTVKINGFTCKVTEISASAFSGCTKATKITIGKNVKKIGSKAFYNCKKLKKVTIATSAKLTNIGNQSFGKCEKLTAITLPKKFSSLGTQAFISCKSLKKITVSSTALTAVGTDALKGIHKKCVIKVPKKKLPRYKNLFANKGQKKSVKIKK